MKFITRNSFLNANTVIVIIRGAETRFMYGDCVAIDSMNNKINTVITMYRLYTLFILSTC
ncbi:hypothetical protein PBN151_1421 [Paenibacillus sp. NAIST15-1]|nr:hypothetical protein PBN151_1421 [Paenibacillus sp. NAIST15-1]